MSISLDLYPTLNKELFTKIGLVTTQPRFSYASDGSYYELNIESNEAHGNTTTTLVLTDENSTWHPDSNNLLLKMDIHIKSPKFLFGQFGIASEDSILGLAMLWMSKSSSQRGTIPLGVVVSSDGNIKVNIENEFSRGQLKGSILFQTVVYLKESKCTNKIFADNSGTLLGVLDDFSLIVDGSGSEFPIIDVNDPSQPLWFVKCNWTDVLTDSFSEENLAICLNRANKKYNMININEGLKNSPFFLELLASAMQIIVQKVMNESKEEIFAQNFSDGSIGQAVFYFLNNFNWDIRSPELLASSIRKDFESRLG